MQAITKTANTEVGARQVADEGMKLTILIMALWIISSWFTGHHIIASFSHDWVTMKFVTAFCFSITAIGWYVNGILSKTLNVFAAGIALFYLMYYMIIGEGPNIVGFDEAGTQTVSENYPSIATLMCFIMIGIGSLLKSSIWAKVVRVFSIIALIGYLIGAPCLYFYFENQSTAMSMPTAGMFLLTSFVAQGAWE